MFDHDCSTYTSIERFEQSTIDLWELEPENVEGLIRSLVIPELLGASGYKFEELFFGYHSTLQSETGPQLTNGDEIREGDASSGPAQEPNPAHLGLDPEFESNLDVALRSVPPGWDPRRPKRLLSMLVLYYTKRELAKYLTEEGKKFSSDAELRQEARTFDVRIYPTLGTVLDESYGTDAVIVFGNKGYYVSIDLTTRPKKRTRADAIVYRHNLMVPDGLQDLARQIVEKFIAKLSTQRE